jgi:hypothetical protein
MPSPTKPSEIFTGYFEMRERSGLRHSSRDIAVDWDVDAVLGAEANRDGEAELTADAEPEVVEEAEKESVTKADSPCKSEGGREEDKLEEVEEGRASSCDKSGGTHEGSEGSFLESED